MDYWDLERVPSDLEYTTNPTKRVRVTWSHPLLPGCRGNGVVIACMYALLLSIPLLFSSPFLPWVYREYVWVGLDPCLDWDTIHASGFYATKPKKKRGTQYMGELVLKIYFNGNHLSEGGYATEYICTVYISVVYVVRSTGVRECLTTCILLLATGLLYIPAS